MVFGKVGVYESAVPRIDQALFLERHADAPYNAALQLAAKRLDVELLAQRKRSHPSDNANRSQISIDPQLAELGAEAVHGTSALRALFIRALRSAFRRRLALDPGLGSCFLLDDAFAIARENLGISDGLRRILLGKKPPIPAVDVARFDIPQWRRLVAARVLRHAHAQRARGRLHCRAGARRGARS